MCKQVFTRHTLLADRLLEIRTELVFQNAVDPLHLLFLSQLETVSDDFCFTVAAVLAGNEISLFNCARGFETTLALQEQFHSFSTAEPANRTDVSRQCILLCPFKLFVSSEADTRCGV